MGILVFSLFFFLLSLVIHCILWQFYYPRNHTKVLLFLFLSVFVIGSFLLRSVSFFGATYPGSPAGLAYLFLVYISFVLAYIVTYSAVEVDSPSLMIVLAIANAGQGGLKKEALDALLTDEILVIPRLQDLLDDGMSYEQDGRFVLTKKGFFWAMFFITFRRLLNREKGG